MSIFPSWRRITDDTEERTRAEVESFLALPPEQRQALRSKAAELATRNARRAATGRKVTTAQMAEGRALSTTIERRLGSHPQFVDDLTTSERAQFWALPEAARQCVFAPALRDLGKRMAQQRAGRR